MLGTDTITISPAVVTAAAAGFVGFAAFWSNPRRALNCTFFTGSLHVSAWLMALHWAVTATDSSKGLFWLKLTCVISASLPLHFRIVKESIVTGLEISVIDWVRVNWGWVLITLFITVIPFTDFFIPSHSTDEHRIRGWGFYAYIILALGLYAYLFRDAYKSYKALTGGRRLELQVWLGGGCVTAATVIALMLANAATKDPSFIRLQPLVVLVFYAGTAFAITTHRIFDARQILLIGVEKSILVVTVAAVAYLLDLGFVQVLPEPFDFLATTALTLWFAGTLNGWLNRMFQFYPQATVARQAAFDVARRETRAENLQEAFLSILKGWGQTEHAIVVSGAKDGLSGSGIELEGDSVVVNGLRELRWATPERITRERFTVEREALAQFLETHNLGVLVLGEGPALTVVVGVGVSASRRPFTYPQVTQLMELASIIENAFERAHFSVKAQHAEQLATVGVLGASLAHEIRNPLVSIKTFVQLLPKHYQDAAFRDKFFRLIGDEVQRIDQLTEQLLDLASPRVYAAQSLELHPILRASLDLVAAKAADKNIRFETDFSASPDRAFTDASAVKQVLLNLSFNAIQAVESREGDRWVKIATRNLPAGLEMTVEDSGPGIAPEIRPRLFQPFQSSKSTGFGLGLAVCSDILAGLNATISVDASVPGRGATFRVTFPCQAS